MGDSGELDRIKDASPEEQRDWWASLSEDECHELIEKYPDVIGNLDGIPLLDRTDANQVYAEQLVASGMPELTPQTQAVVQQVADGTIVAVRFDPYNEEMIQMIGVPSEATEHVINYAPGTYTTLDDFAYDGNGNRGAFGSIDWILSQHSEDTVAFLYVNNQWADEIPGVQVPNPSGKHEGYGANDEQVAMDAGEYVASFTDGVLMSEPNLMNAKLSGVGHSFGHSVITASEVAGIEYDVVVSYSGSNCVPDWSPSGGTQYANIQYDNDVLNPAQQFNVLYGGSGYNPDDRNGVYSTTEFRSDYVVTSNGTCTDQTGATDMQGSHNRIMNPPAFIDGQGREVSHWNTGPTEALEQTLYE